MNIEQPMNEIVISCETHIVFKFGMAAMNNSGTACFTAKSVEHYRFVGQTDGGVVLAHKLTGDTSTTNMFFHNPKIAEKVQEWINAYGLKIEN